MILLVLLVSQVRLGRLGLGRLRRVSVGLLQAAGSSGAARSRQLVLAWNAIRGQLVQQLVESVWTEQHFPLAAEARNELE